MLKNHAITGAAIAIALGAIVGPMIVQQAKTTYANVRHRVTMHLVAEYLRPELWADDKTKQVKPYNRETWNLSQCEAHLYVATTRGRRLQTAIDDVREFLNSQPKHE